MAPAGKVELDEAEVTRLAMRVTMSAFSQLHSKASSMSDVEIMKEYIRMCPYLAPDSPAVQAALDGLVNAKSKSFNLPISEPTSSADSSPTALKSSILVDSKIMGRELNLEMMNLESRTKKTNVMWKMLILFGYLVRTLILDFPLALCFAAYFAAAWTHRLHDLYLEPQIKALVWDDNRMYEEETYYKRQCDIRDQSTHNGADLFLPLNATAEDAYEHQLTHGLTVFRSALSDKTATDLRNYIRSKNFKLRKEESIFVIANKNRYSFGLGTEEPSVTKAIMELASNKRLKPALEKILGPNPALIEMTAITSTYGAKDQYWHDDVIARASAIQFGRAFGPSYSVFIQLQNTTKEMGATDCCPGSHFCSAGAIGSFCDTHGFQVVNEEGFWRAGDALLMNMNTVHRGAAHTLEGGEDRVMLILTFVPKPRTYAESRQMSQGITFSLRWDMWGHTLDDLAKADTRMAQPWATLRALGLYKQKDASWGIDYISGASMRIANEDNGFRQDELVEFMKNGLGPLPKFLYGEIDTDHEGWREFFLATVVKCEDFFKTVNLVALTVYMLLQIMVLVIGLAFSPTGKAGPFRRFGWVLVRLLITHGIVYALYLAAIEHVDNTQWARDIKAGRRYTNPFTFPIIGEFDGPTTWPYREDILIETRYKTEALAMYNDFAMAHPGNRQWKALLESTAPLYVAYGGLPKVFRKQLAEYIVSSMESQSRRFLYQREDSHWILMSREDALAYNNKELAISSSPIRRHVYTSLEYLISDLTTGHMRDYRMTEHDMLPYLRDIQDKLIKSFDEKSLVTMVRPKMPDEPEAIPPQTIKLALRSYSITKPECKSRFVRRPQSLAVGVNPGEPSPGVWIVEGDVVEARYKGPPQNQYKWYYGTVRLIASSGWHTVEFRNGKTRYISTDSLRAYVPFSKGEKVGYFIKGNYEKSSILRVHDDGDHVDIVHSKTGKKILNVSKADIRRANTKPIIKVQETKYY